MSSSVHWNAIDGAITTNDATPTTILAIPASDPNVSIRVDLTVIARNPTTSDGKTWNQLLLVDKTGGQTPTMPVAAQNVTAPMGTLGSASWALATSFEGSNIFIQVQGQLGSSINWFASASPVAVMGD